MTECLESLRREGEIAYGMHVADTALLTCLVFDLDESRHVHFVDGGDGGYALAAMQLKAQLHEVRPHGIETDRTDPVPLPRAA